MKQKDMTILVVVIIVSVLFSYVISSKILIAPKSRQQQVEVVGSVPSSLPTPSSTEFNSSSIDPTQSIQITQNSNTSPFGNGSTP